MNQAVRKETIINNSRVSLSFIMLLAAGTIALGSGIDARDTTLGNGLRVVVCENHASPVVTTQVWYRVGSYYEHSGYTGISHLLEHMMFKGSRGFPGGKYSELVEEQGGRENAFTSDLYTVFWAELASDRYELELKLEADRMNNLVLDSVEFERERNVVMEERRLGENDPTDALWEGFYATAFTIHPFRNPIVGWMDDLQRLRRSDLVAYYHNYYTPSNAVLVVVGDVKTATVFAQAARYFGGIRSHPVPVWHPVEPEQRGERTLVVKRDVQTPTLMLGYHVPGSYVPDFYAFEVMQGLLMRGIVSRLYARLVYREQSVLSIWGGNDTQREPGIFYFFVTPRSEAVIDTVLGEIYDELESLKTVPVRDSELVRVKNQVTADFIYGQDDNGGLAYQIGQSFTVYGSLDYANLYPDRVGAVTRDDLMRCARRYFTQDNRTVGRLLAGPADRHEEGQ